jgi:O-antigen/teichoic acid export membrane protein
MQPLESWTRYLPAPLRSRLEGRHNLLRILANVCWLFADQILRLCVGLLVAIWVTRHLGPEQFGALNYSLAIVALLTPIAVFGLDNLLVRDLVREPARSQETVGTAFMLRLLAGVVTLAVAIAASVGLNRDDPLQQLLTVVVSVMLPLHAFNTIDFWFQAHVRSKYSVLARNASLLVVSAIRIALVLTKAPLVAFAIAYALESLLTALALVVAYRHHGLRLRDWRPTVARSRELLGTSWPLMLSALGLAISMRIDQLLLAELRGDADLGIYAAAVRVSELWYIIPNAILLSVAPTLTAAKRSDPALYERRVRQALKTMAGLAYLVAIPITLVSGPLIYLLYGSQFADAGATLAIHIWAALFYSVGGVLTLWLVNEGLTWFSLISTSAGALANVILNLALIPAYGPNGAAIATVVSYAITFVAITFLFRATRPFGRMMLRALLLRT